MVKKRTLIRNSVIITIDKKLGDFERADILIEDDVIAAVEPNLPVEDAQLIDGSTMIALPGLIDTHRHTCDLDRVYRLAVETRNHLFAATGVPTGSTPLGLSGVA
jgi:cytosine/adenosine deaminase-related metal-dependent hydrolase